MNITIDMARACHTKGFLNQISKLIDLQEEILKHRADGVSEKLDAAVCDLLTGCASELPKKITDVFADMQAIRVNGERITDKTVTNDEVVLKEIESVKTGLAESFAHANALAAAADARAAWRKKDAELVKSFETALAAFAEDCKRHNRDCLNFEMAREAKAREEAEQRRLQIEWAREQKAKAEACLRSLGA